MSRSLRILLVTSSLIATKLDMSAALNGDETGTPNGVFIHMFDWKFKDIAVECETFLGPHGFGGVEVSPIHETLVIHNRPWYDSVLKKIPYAKNVFDAIPFYERLVSARPWYERYQLVSYQIKSRSGDESDFRDMVNRCNKVGVKVYVSVVLNHMTGVYTTKEVGSGGSVADTVNFNYPGVPYTKEDFNQPTCPIMDENNEVQVRNCELNGLHDLNQKNPCVRDKMRNYLNHLISLGVAGFRLDTAKYMWPADIKNIFSRIDFLNFAHGFRDETDAFLYQDVNSVANEGKIQPSVYYETGLVTDYKYSYEVSRAFKREKKLANLQYLSTKQTGLVDSSKSIVFIDTHDSQRGFGYNAKDILSYKTREPYEMAVAFMLAYPHGIPRLMSSYDFKNAEQGPPTADDGVTIADVHDRNKNCYKVWICEQRWNTTHNMVTFRNVVADAPVTHWWSRGDNQLAFSRGDKGFIVFNNDMKDDLQQKIQTGLKAGTYCDVITGTVNGRGCTGRSVTVNSKGVVEITLKLKDKHPNLIAIHEKVRNCELNGLHDLNQKNPCVRDKMRNYLNHLISLGVAGFRLDTAKYMWPADIKNIFSRIDFLNFAHGFRDETDAFLYQDVNSVANEGKIQPSVYYETGLVTDYKYSYEVSRAFKREKKLANLQYLSTKQTGLVDSSKSIVFIDTHDSQRGFGYNAKDILSYKTREPYEMAVAFMLAYPHGIPRLMSSYDFKNAEQGPPTADDGVTIADVHDRNKNCYKVWICEQRWNTTHNMVTFRNVVADAPVTHWWSRGDNQLAFSRGDKGFIVFNNDMKDDLQQKIQTGLKAGTYCDVITGTVNGRGCTGRSVTVNSKGVVEITLKLKDKHPNLIAIHEKVRNCELNGLHDLNQKNPCVRDKMRNYLNHLISLGVAGFRLDTAKYMWPADIKNIFSRIDFLNFAHGFRDETDAFLYQDVNSVANEGKIQPSVYYETGLVTDYKYSYEVSRAFKREKKLANLQYLSTKQTGLVDSSKSIVFIDTHDSQRGFGYNAKDILSYKTREPYEMAVAFMLAYPHGIPRLMSSYDFKNAEQGPPTADDGVTIADVHDRNKNCYKVWICEQRWNTTHNMVTFRNVVADAPVTHWWSRGDNQLAFSRGDKGFIVFNNDMKDDLQQKIQTGLKAGTYCDVITGTVNGRGCTGRSVTVNSKGVVEITLKLKDKHPNLIAIHEKEMIRT